MFDKARTVQSIEFAQTREIETKKSKKDQGLPSCVRQDGLDLNMNYEGVMMKS